MAAVDELGCPASGGLSGSLEEAAGACDGNTLVHDPFAHTQVLVHPLGDFLVVAGDPVRLEAISRISTAPNEVFETPTTMRKSSLTSGRSIASCPPGTRKLLGRISM